MSKCLYDVARVLRSKNAGPFALTFDVLFDDEAVYKDIKARRLITREKVAELYGLPKELVGEPVYFDSALGVKVTVSREVSSGSPLDTDVYGAQQHAPLMNLPV